MAEKRAKLMAMDVEDLNILSAYCQDAVLKIGDINFSVSENRFVLEMNRFVWEKTVSRKSVPERRRAVLHFQQVKSVSSTGINQAAKQMILSLLAIRFETTSEPSGIVELVFSSDSGKKAEVAIRLEVDCIEAQFADMQSSWAASSVPNHPS